MLDYMVLKSSVGGILLLHWENSLGSTLELKVIKFLELSVASLKKLI